MTSEDVVASLKRWMKVAQRGKQTAEKVASVEAPDAATIQIVLKEPFAPLLPLLVPSTSAAIIMPAEKQAQPMKESVGTGPYKLKERKPDQYIQLVRFDGYVPREDARQPAMAARASSLSRRDPLRAGAERQHPRRGRALPASSTTPTRCRSNPSTALKGQAQSEPIVFKPFGWPVFVMNTKQGVITDPALRRAVLAA